MAKESDTLIHPRSTKSLLVESRIINVNFNQNFTQKVKMINEPEDMKSNIMAIEEPQFFLAICMTTRRVLGFFSFFFQATRIFHISYFMFREMESNKEAQGSGLSLCPMTLLVSVWFVTDLGFQILLIYRTITFVLWGNPLLIWYVKKMTKFMAGT